MNNNRKIYFLYSLIFLLLEGLAVSVAYSEEIIYYSHFSGIYWQVWAMDKNGANNQKITDDTGDKRNPLRDNNQKLFYETNRGELYSRQLNTTVKNRLFKQVPYINGFDINSKGDKIAMAVFRTDTQDLSNIWLADLKKELKPKRITNQIGIVRSPKWHPKENKLLFTVYKRGETEDIYLLDLDTNETQLILNDTFNNIYASFLPDGQNIVFASDRNGHYDICLLEVNTNKVTILTSYKSLDTFPRFSKEGDYIFYVSNRTGILQIWRMNKDGSDKKQLTFGENPSKF